MSVHKEVSKYMSSIAKRRTPESYAVNKELALRSAEKRRAPAPQMEAGYRAVLDGESVSKAARDIAKCRYDRFKAYCQGRQDGTIKDPRK